MLFSFYCSLPSGDEIKVAGDLPSNDVLEIAQNFENPGDCIEAINRIEEALNEILGFVGEEWSRFPLSSNALVTLLMNELQAYLEVVPEVTDCSELGKKVDIRLPDIACSFLFGKA